MSGPLAGPFAGQAINCRSCHFVTEFQGVTGAGNRTYSDFTTRSPIPRDAAERIRPYAAQLHADGGFVYVASGPLFLHFDGEFASGEDLVVGTLTGRNFGWLPSQYNDAIAHIAKMIREDDGSSQLAADRLDGLSYAVHLQRNRLANHSRFAAAAFAAARCHDCNRYAGSERDRAVHGART